MSEDYRELIRPVFDIVDIYHDAAAFHRSCEGIPRELLLVYAAHFAQSEVHNGGLLQLFWNSTGILMPEAIEGFTVVGMKQVAGAFGQAASLLGNPFPRDRDDRWDALLVASDLSEETLKQVFVAEGNLYTAFDRATSSLGLRAMDEQIWQLMKEENSGFSSAATRFLQNS